MPKLKEVSQLFKAFDHLQDLIDVARTSIEEKREWLEDKSENYQESDAGQEWDAYLSAAETFIDDLENIDTSEIE